MISVELLDLLVRERGGRLVHDDDLRVDRHGAGDGDEMLVGDRRGRAAARRDRGRPRARVENFARMRARIAASRGSRSASRDRVAEEDVLGDRQIVEQHGFLMDGGDAMAEGGLALGRVTVWPSRRCVPASGW